MDNKLYFIGYRVTSRLYFHLPIIFLLFWSLNIDFMAVMLITAIYGLSSNLASFFIKNITNKYNSKTIIIFGEILKSLGLLFIFFGAYPGNVNFITIFFGQIIGGLGFSIALSADNGLIKQITNNNPLDFTKLQSKTQSLMFISTLFAGFIGGILFQYNMTWPIIAGIIVSILSCFIVFFINIENAHKDHEREKISRNFLDKISSDTKKWIFYYALLRAFTLAPFVGLLPLYFLIRNLDPYLFGLVLGLFTLGGFIFSLHGYKILKEIDSNRLFFIMLSAIIISLSCFILENYFYYYGINLFYLSLVGMFILGLSSGSIRTIVVPRIKIDHLDKNEQILVFSYMEKMFGYLNALILILIGLITSYFDIIYALLTIVLVMIFISISEF